MQALTLKLTLISECCPEMMMAVAILKETHHPTAVSAHNVMGDLESYLFLQKKKETKGGLEAKQMRYLEKWGFERREGHSTVSKISSTWS